MTWAVAAIAVETGIQPSELMADSHMLRAVMAVLQDRAKRQAR